MIRPNQTLHITPLATLRSQVNETSDHVVHFVKEIGDINKYKIELEFFYLYDNSDLLNGSDNDNSKFATKKWYIIDSESKGNYLPDNEIKFLTSSLESNLCDYSDAYILVTGNINITGGNDNTKVAFKNCVPFKKCRTEINETFVDEAEH